ATARDVLAKKANAIDLTQPQVFPQFAFGRGLFAAQFARASFHGCVIRHGLTLVRALRINRTTSPSVPFRKRRRSKASLLRNACKSHPPQSPFVPKGEAKHHPFLRKGEDKHNASRSFTPFGTKGVDAKRRGDVRPYARDTTPSRTCTRTATSD